LFERAKSNANVDLTYLDVKQEFKLNPKATFKQAKTELMATFTQIRETTHEKNSSMLRSGQLSNNIKSVNP